MAHTLRYLRAMADPTRLRILALLRHEELSVQELQEITRLCQSRISTHLGLLQETGLLSSRREGKRTFYRLSTDLRPEASGFVHIAVQGAAEMPEHEDDKLNLKRVLLQRQDKAQVFFNQVAGRFDRSYGPGRSWQAFGQLLLRVMPQIVVADLGSGEGLVSELLARRARKVIAVDNSEKIVAYGAAKAKKNGIKNLEFRLGDLEDPPIEPSSVDLVILSQALHHAVQPDRAICAAHRILRAGGQIVLLDLLHHQYEQARELHGDLWLGFSEGELHRWLDQAGFVQLELTVVSREENAPHLQTLLAYGERPK
jgi:ubiquinone/menaquinone biosynthesis C-methylase UbiE/DNA-binding transcriptional ArsR family regulator